MTASTNAAASERPVASAPVYDPSKPCPACKEVISAYIPPDRGLGGPLAYPALLLHYEQKHAGIAPPEPPAGDTWEPMPPAAADWRAVDKEALKKGLVQPAGVWPPVRMAKQNPE